MRATYRLRDEDGAEFADACIEDDRVVDPVVEGQLEVMRKFLAFVADDPRGAFVLAQRVVNREISQTNIAARFEKVFRTPIAQKNIHQRIQKCAEQFPQLRPILEAR